MTDNALSDNKGEELGLKREEVLLKRDEFALKQQELEQKRQALLVDIWKQAVDTQKHFNDQCLKSRQLGLTFVAAALGAALFLFTRSYVAGTPNTSSAYAYAFSICGKEVNLHVGASSRWRWPRCTRSLDNTLYDWYSAFIPAFYAMVDRAVDVMQCDRERLLDELRAVHVRFHNVEHPFSLLKTSIYQEFASNSASDARNLIDPALHAFNSARKHSLALFPGVVETLEAVQSRSIKMVAFTDSSYFRRHRPYQAVRAWILLFSRVLSGASRTRDPCAGRAG